MTDITDIADEENVRETAKVIAEILESRGVNVYRVVQQLLRPWTAHDPEHYERTQTNISIRMLGAVHYSPELDKWRWQLTGLREGRRLSGFADSLEEAKSMVEGNLDDLS